MSKALAVIILAAGKGTRMNSSRPKVLHDLAGLPLISHVLSSVRELKPKDIIVVLSPEQQEVKSVLDSCHVVYQAKALGTGDAVKAAVGALGEFDGTVLIAFGADPLIGSGTLKKITNARNIEDPPDVVVFGFKAPTPNTYGRLLQNSQGGLQKIVEATEAEDINQFIELYNGGAMAIDGKKLPIFLDCLEANNSKGEYYLTDIVEISNQDGGYVSVVEGDESEALGIDTQQDLARAENIMQSRLRSQMMSNGVSFLAPETVFLSYDTKIGRDSIVYPHVVFGKGVHIGENCEIKSFSHIEGAKVGNGSIIGPYARLREGTDISNDVRIGNFVEVKKSQIGEGSKVNHLSYVGDAEIGAATNIGAGTITCNYDGVRKYTTKIGSNTFIGSNVALVAPVEVGDSAIVGAGSTITKTVPENAIALTRTEMRQVSGGASRFRAKKQSKE